jgi:hypothetical protein
MPASGALNEFEDLVTFDADRGTGRRLFRTEYDGPSAAGCRYCSSLERPRYGR